MSWENDFVMGLRGFPLCVMKFSISLEPRQQKKNQLLLPTESSRRVIKIRRPILRIIKK
jgi:hypothetical protein